MKYIKLFESFNYDIKIVCEDEYEKFITNHSLQSFTSKELKFLQFSYNDSVTVIESFSGGTTIYLSLYRIDDVNNSSIEIILHKFDDEYYIMNIEGYHFGQIYCIIEWINDLEFLIKNIINSFQSGNLKDKKDILKLLN